jgi:hypothetical protein
MVAIRTCRSWDRGWSRSEAKAGTDDGAEWIWNLDERHFPGAIETGRGASAIIALRYG